MDWLDELQEYVHAYSTAPTLAQMPRLGLAQKGIEGPTSAHRIEEIHTPLNLAFTSFTTGSTAFQNIVGVTAAEIADRTEASKNVFARCGLETGDTLLVSYPPLVNVFPAAALQQVGIRWRFLEVSSRDALLLALCETQPRAVIGESSFLRAALEAAKRMDLLEKLPHGLVLLAAGTPLDRELPPFAAAIGAQLHDLYGCQEFGWLTLDGLPLRQDIRLLPGEGENAALLVGGLPTGDCFPVLEKGHLCGQEGNIITYARQRDEQELETTVLETTAASVETAERLARSILRIKARVVRVAPGCKTGAAATVLSVEPRNAPGQAVKLQGPKETRLFDSLLEAQLAYQAKAKHDEAWNKTR